MADLQQHKTSAKYLTHYAEPEVLSLVTFPKESVYQHVIVIPAFQESTQFIERFITSGLVEQQCLVIVVINQPDNDFGRQHQQDQIDLAQYIANQGQETWQQDNLRLIELSTAKESNAKENGVKENSAEQRNTEQNSAKQTKNVNSSVLIVDRYSKSIPTEQGVGLARKIGADLAIKLAATGNIVSSWVHSTDADAHLPDNYLSAHNSDNSALKNTAATCCNFFHHSDTASIHQANQRYENALRYYVAGLAYAKSPYAYFTIGSILSFDMLAYCQARGFPKRSAGEDFYLLNKLAKLGRVTYLDNVVIKLDARPSQRVPFGTGPAVQHIMQLESQGLDYAYYHPEIFTELKTVLKAFESLWKNKQHPQAWLAELSQISQQALTHVGLLSFITKQSTAKQEQFEKQLIVWFDSFKTLKFIHALRDLGLENMPLEEAIESADFNL